MRMGSAPDSWSGGRWFKSSHPYQEKFPLLPPPSPTQRVSAGISSLGEIGKRTVCAIRGTLVLRDRYSEQCLQTTVTGVSLND